MLMKMGPETRFSFNFIWNSEWYWVGFNEAFGFVDVIRWKSCNRKWKGEHTYDTVDQMRADIEHLKHGELPDFIENLTWEKVVQADIYDIWQPYYAYKPTTKIDWVQ